MTTRPRPDRRSTRCSLVTSSGSSSSRRPTADHWCCDRRSRWPPGPQVEAGDGVPGPGGAVPGRGDHPGRVACRADACAGARPRRPGDSRCFCASRIQSRSTRSRSGHPESSSVRSCVSRPSSPPGAAGPGGPGAAWTGDRQQGVGAARRRPRPAGVASASSPRARGGRRDRHARAHPICARGGWGHVCGPREVGRLHHRGIFPVADLVVLRLAGPRPGHSSRDRLPRRPRLGEHDRASDDRAARNPADAAVCLGPSEGPATGPGRGPAAADAAAVAAVHARPVGPLPTTRFRSCWPCSRGRC